MTYTAEPTPWPVNLALSQSLAQRLAVPVADCYRRAVLAVESLADPTAQYVEGVAIVRLGAGSLVPTEHGWVEVPGQYIVDTKWPDGRGVAYFPVLRRTSAEIIISPGGTIRLPLSDRQRQQRAAQRSHWRAAWLAAVAYIRTSAQSATPVGEEGGSHEQA